MDIDKKIEGQIQIRVRSDEVDPYKIAHHSNYIAWYEVGRIDYIETYMADWLKDISLAYKHGRLEYFKSKFVNAVHMDDVLNVQTRLEKYEKTEDHIVLEFKQKLKNNTTGKIANTSVARVNYEIVGGKSGLGK